MSEYLNGSGQQAAGNAQINDAIRGQIGQARATVADLIRRHDRITGKAAEAAGAPAGGSDPGQIEDPAGGSVQDPDESGAANFDKSLADEVAREIIGRRK